MKRSVHLRHALAVLLGWLLCTGCRDDGGYKHVDFSRPLAAHRLAAQHDKRPADGTLRVAVAAMVSPQETFHYYYELLNYIGQRVDRAVEITQRRTYEEIDTLFAQQRIELAFICSGPYALGRGTYGFEALATPVVRGDPHYQAYLIVKHSLPIEDFEQLRGYRFAFTDPQSNSGALVPRFWLRQLGETPESFFSQTIYTYSHDNSILAVARGLVDAACVDGHKWEFYNRTNPAHTAMTRVIRKSEPVGSPPLVAARHLAAGLKDHIARQLVTMHETREGRILLDRLMIDRFVTPEESWYQPVRDMARASEQGH
jgi:phosphonate transport system substrate-binding protein